MLPTSVEMAVMLRPSCHSPSERHYESISGWVKTVFRRARSCALATPALAWELNSRDYRKKPRSASRRISTNSIRPTHLARKAASNQGSRRFFASSRVKSATNTGSGPRMTGAKDKPSQMKIGITCYPTYGGSGVVATELGLELAQRGHE